jgi:hypothetical protein
MFALAGTAFSVPACSNDMAPTSGDDGSGSGSNVGDEWDQLLGQREYDYNAALKIAALRLTGDLPTMAEISEIGSAGDVATKKSLYNARITDYMSRPTYAKQMFYFWRDTFKIGESAEFDTAPALAAQLSVQNGAYTSLFTANTANCPTFNETDGTFAAGECGNGGPIAGVLTNPGVMKQFYSNFGFRRVRWIQEVFDCTKFPAELSATPTDVGGVSPYTGVWPFNSIASPTNGGGRVNFQDVSAVICANCHTTINHIAPLIANYDINGKYQSTIAVPTPLDGSPPAALSDYLPAGETTAWRFGVAAADLPGLGSAMAADPAVATCGVARMWNWALGKTDIVDTLQEVPVETIQTQLDQFIANGHKMKDLVFAVYTSDDFVKF